MITSHKLLCFLMVLLLATQNAIAQDLRTSLMQSISQREESSWAMAQKIWDFAEPGYLEKQSSNLIANALNKEGFIIAKGIAEIPTAFSATLGSGKPVIAILGEYDALPEIAQEAVPFRKPKEGGNGYGQACGHHLFGVASANAAMAIGASVNLARTAVPTWRSKRYGTSDLNFGILRVQKPPQQQNELQRLIIF
jgi:aminobenzoyl-glutamate utilization protein B